MFELYQSTSLVIFALFAPKLFDCRMKTLLEIQW
jgi:hypothetical protein